MKKNIAHLCLPLVSGLFAFILIFPAMASENILIYGRGGDSLTMDPAGSDDTESSKVYTNIFETLISFKDGTTELKPCLAKSWRMSDDSKEWTFLLKKFVYFHDGTVFNADSVKYSFDRIIDESHPNYRENFPYKVFFDYIDRIEVLSTNQVKFILKTSRAPFLNNLCLPSAAIISKASLKKWRGNIKKHPVGTGPFKFVNWVPGERIILKKNEYYRDGAPKIDTLIFKVIENDFDRLNALRSDTIQIMDGFSYSVIHNFNKDENLKLWKGQGINVGYLALNTKHTPLDNQKVRKAINHAINTEKLISLFCQDIAVKAVNPIPSNQWGFNKEIAGYEYNPGKAKALLKEAGYGDGFKLTFLTSPVSRSYLPYPDKFALFIKANLEAVGIKIKIYKHEWKKFRQKIKDRNFDIIMMGWNSDNGDPDNFLFTLFHGKNTQGEMPFNLAGIQIPQLDQLLETAQKVPAKAERISLYKKAQEIIHNQAPWVPMAHGQVLIAARKEIKELILMPVIPNVRLDKVWIEK